MNKEYKIKLDLNKKLYNKKMMFNQFDENVNDFYIEVTKNNEVVKDLDKSIITLVAIKPNSEVDAQFIEVKEGQIYADLKPSMCDLVGNYQAKAMIVLEGEIVTTDTINYSVNEDKIISKLNDDVVSDERFTLFTDALARLSSIEISEEQRMINEAERILSEENRKIEEAKRVEAELVRQHEEADRTKYDAIRESNENIRKQNESIRLSNESNRIDEEAKRIEEENKRKLAEEERNANYNFMTEDEERRRSEANAHKEAEALRVQAETNRVNEEAKRRTTEQARVSAENTRVNNENTREANEVVRKNNENQRVEAETQRQSRYNSFIVDAEANANNFENYTNNAKVKEEERKANELDRKSQEDRRVSNEVERISNENTRKANEVTREENEVSRQNVFENKVSEVDEKISEINTTKDNFISNINTKVDNKISELDNAKSDMTTTVTNKVNEVEGRFNALTASQQQSSEVIDARDGETSLKARLDRDIEKAKQVYVNVEGSNISTDSSSGYAKDVEILGNTIQSASNLADIRSVGDTVEGQELYEIPVLSVGKNLIYTDSEKWVLGSWNQWDYNIVDSTNTITLYDYLNVSSYLQCTISIDSNWKYQMSFYNANKERIYIDDSFGNYSSSSKQINFATITNEKISYIRVNLMKTDESNINTSDIQSAKLQLEESVATPYEPYVEDKLTILSPVQLEKVGDVADRIIEKDGVWGVEKNIVNYNLTKDLNWAQGRGTTVDGIQYFGYKTVIPNPVRPLSATVMPNLLCNYCKPVSNFAQFTASDGINTISQYTDSDEIQIMNTSEVFNSVDSFKNWISNKTIYVKYPTTQPQFIPLPHSQQIKLRTFANKTNISFGCEIEGTIKAQVPKSLGATVNTHTEQINNLNKELDRVKKLEESTVSTVTTESDFTTVEATSNGYFEDVKLEGKTLVNLCGGKTNLFSSGRIDYPFSTDGTDKTQFIARCEPNKTYTIFKSKPTNRFLIKQTDKLEVGNTAYHLNGLDDGSTDTFITVTTKDNAKFLWIYVSNEIIDCDVLVLEGDHTQNPPAYFEGLKSVGDGADEIVVSSVKGDGNLFDVDKIVSNYTEYFKCNDYIKYSNGAQYTYLKQDFEPNTQYSFTIKASNNTPSNIDFTCKYTDGTYSAFTIYNTTANSIYTRTFTSDANKSIEYFGSFYSDGSIITVYLDGTCINKGTTPKPYTPHQSDKKRLLYYNEETQAWEKPILRQWDSIEKHADGKYYYHQRSGEVVLNGSEDWRVDVGVSSQVDTICFTYNDKTLLDTGALICTSIVDKFKVDGFYVTFNSKDCESYSTGWQQHYIKIQRSKLTTQDVQGFKQWLQANNVTVVYQLAEEKVYECTNIDLITYSNETNYVVNSGAIVPRTTLKVHNNISNVVSLLQKKVSLLESNIKASQEVQDMMILETDMRMLDIELALMEFAPMTLNLGGSNMLRSATYFNFLKNHIINETYEKEYLENVMNKYLATGRINQDEYNELYKMLYPPVYDIELPIEY